MSITPIRLFFQKKGRLKYISHLDTMNVLTKAIARAKLPVWYTEGFNPHVYLTICLPLSLGYEGKEECFDIKLVEEIPLEQLVERLNKVLPEEMNILEAIVPILPVSEISWADYDLVLYYPENAKNVFQQLGVFLEQDQIITSKKSKKGLINVDIAPYIKNITLKNDEDHVLISLRLAAGGSVNINPRLIWQSFTEDSGFAPEGTSVVRKQILDSQEDVFK